MESIIAAQPNRIVFPWQSGLIETSPPTVHKNEPPRRNPFVATFVAVLVGSPKNSKEDSPKNPKNQSEAGRMP
jgi:hypothetical protein